MKKRYLLLALSLISTVGLSSVGSFALPEKKEALTPPSNWDFKLQSRLDEEYYSHIWSWGTPSFSRDLILDKNGGNTWNGAGFTFNFPIFSIENLLQVGTLKTVVTTSFIWDEGGDIALWSSNELNVEVPPVSPLVMTIENTSIYWFKLNLDTSSNTVSRSYTMNVNNTGNMDLLSYNNSLRQFLLLPPFSSAVLFAPPANQTIDAIYIDVLPPTQGFNGYIDFVEDNAYDQGYIDAAFNDVNWFNVIFIEGFGGVLSFIGNYEVLPNLKVFYIIGFTMVLAIVGFVAGQRKKE